MSDIRNCSCTIKYVHGLDLKFDLDHVIKMIWRFSIRRHFGKFVGIQNQCSLNQDKNGFRHPVWDIRCAYSNCQILSRSSDRRAETDHIAVTGLFCDCFTNIRDTFVRKITRRNWKTSGLIIKTGGKDDPIQINLLGIPILNFPRVKDVIFSKPCTYFKSTCAF